MELSFRPLERRARVTNPLKNVKKRRFEAFGRQTTLLLTPGCACADLGHTRASYGCAKNPKGI
jgi:hypothetical protein